jgi:hypothetical protein
LAGIYRTMKSLSIMEVPHKGDYYTSFLFFRRLCRFFSVHDQIKGFYVDFNEYPKYGINIGEGEDFMFWIFAFVIAIAAIVGNQMVGLRRLEAIQKNLEEINKKIRNEDYS